MIVKGITEEDFVNYKETSMFIAFPKCTFKCEEDCGERVCQNGALASAPIMTVDENDVIKKYLNNAITSAIVMGGLEPMDSFENVVDFINLLRCTYHCDDTIVIYTGYNKAEIQTMVNALKKYNNIIIKFGRFIPDHTKHYDEVLGVELASDNQYAERIS